MVVLAATRLSIATTQTYDLHCRYIPKYAFFAGHTSTNTMLPSALLSSQITVPSSNTTVASIAVSVVSYSQPSEPTNVPSFSTVSWICIVYLLST